MKKTLLAVFLVISIGFMAIKCSEPLKSELNKETFLKYPKNSAHLKIKKSLKIKAPELETNTKIKELTHMHPCEVLNFFENNQEEVPTNYLNDPVLTILDSYLKSNKVIKIVTDDDFNILLGHLWTVNDQLPAFIPNLEAKFEKIKFTHKREKDMQKYLIDYKSMLADEIDNHFDKTIKHSKILFEQGELKKSLRELKDLSLTDGYHYRRNLTVHRILNMAKTPNQIAVALHSIKDIPEQDYSFLLKLRDKIKTKEATEILDELAQTIITEQQSRKYSFLRSEKHYQLAKSLHSKLDFLKSQPKFDVLNHSSKYNTVVIEGIDECDDRKFVSLCDKFCKN
jgi:hypothetical protein